MPELQFTSNAAEVVFLIDASMAGEVSLVLPNATGELPIQMLVKTDSRIF